MKSVLERKIGMCLDELDEYLRDYKFSPETLMATVGYYMDEGILDPSSFEEIVSDVDRFLWRYAEAGSISPDTFVNLVTVTTTKPFSILVRNSKEDSNALKNALFGYHMQELQGLKSFIGRLSKSDCKAVYILKLVYSARFWSVAIRLGCLRSSL